MILSNQARCLKCGDEPYSAWRWNYKNCKCGAIFVDGGLSYIRHGFDDVTSYENMSIEISELELETCMSALDWCDETKRNNLGRVCAIFRALRDTGFLEKIK